MAGALALVGGAEFMSGNEDHDRSLITAARAGELLILPTAAARHAPERAVETACRWFETLDAPGAGLPVLTRRDAADPALAARAASAGMVYIAGGDPGLLLDVLEGSAVWAGVLSAWEQGASLAGSSAGAMVLARSMLVRASWPDRSRRRRRPALGVVAADAVLPHFNGFGRTWVPSALAAIAGDLLLLGIDEATAALWREGAWSVSGPGAVTLVRRDGESVAHAGARLDIASPGAP